MKPKKYDEVVFVDSKGHKWNKSNLIELIEALHKQKESIDTINYYFE